MEGGPRPSARGGGNYGQTEGRQTDETWLPYTRGGGWEASLPWQDSGGEVRGRTRGGAWGPGFITKGGADS